MATVASLLVATSGCIRRRDASSEGVAEYAITVHLEAPPRERGAGGTCEIASRTATDDAFALNATLYLDNEPGLGRQQTTMVAGVVNDRQRCRVTVGFLFVQPNAESYVLRTTGGTDWRMTNAEAFSGPVIDLVERPPGNV